MSGGADPRLPTICLAASGGGHVRQILDLKPVWEKYPRFFVTEDTALGRSIAEEEETHFVPHFAIGQARLGRPWTMIAEAWRSVFRSWRIIARRRPDLFITTGAGSQLFVMLFARLTGAHVILIDSFARFTRPSGFARLAGWIAHVRIAQSAESAAQWRGALVFDPFRTLDGPPPEKEPLLFATVGATLPFDRLVRLVEEAHAAGEIPQRIVLQRGVGGQQPATLASVETLPFGEVRELLERADIVVCHGGTGSLITALRAHCRVIAVPRLFALGEHYDDHQAEITAAFAERGLIEVVGADEPLGPALDRARRRQPVAATTDPSALIAYLDGVAAGMIR
ncbi:beta-1,4-glucuronosyltransferase WelK [uncultured Sphingomonas sp.]|uniref:beta-1,4-glucuronosyltransferase WelK n=1 Tax=uncultured Sphingomonas sp. TaxID=158754 RepID=UPI0026287331|nr:glycosyltransferase [uncultured Sphingomonas sp.]